MTLPQDSVDSGRYRTLIVALWLAALLSFSGGALAWRIPGAHWVEWGVFAVTGLILLVLLPVARKARREGRKAALERLAVVVLVLGGIVMLQRMLFNAFGPPMADPAANPFRPVFQFVPFFFIATFALLPARRALTLCWFSWGVVAVIAVAGLSRVGFTTYREGAMALLMWMLVGNPLFILLLHVLPRYEQALADSNDEIERMRVRTGLMDRLAESEHRFNLVVEGLQVGVWDRWLYPEHRHWWSPRFYELIGYAPDEIPASEATLRRLLHPDDRDPVWKQGSEQLLRDGGMDINFRLLTKDRGYRWFNSHAKAVRGPQGRVVRITGAIADIHDRKMAEQALHDVQAELTRMAYRDTLTDLYNRRHFDEQFKRETERARRSGLPLSLALIDLDHFKAFNDQYGHAAGDVCLAEMARKIAGTLSRPGDLAARLGGEEFAVLLPETDADGALRVAEKMHAAVLEEAIPHESSPLGRVTLSIGIATLDNPDLTAQVLFDHADGALYHVKNSGRNGYVHHRVVVEARRASIKSVA